jgi:hypothetical protein
MSVKKLQKIIASDIDAVIFDDKLNMFSKRFQHFFRDEAGRAIG